MTVSRVALVFPGQGSQAVGMGRDIYDAFPAARQVFDAADRALGFPLTRLCFEGPEDELRQTVNVQPAIVAVSLALLAAAEAARPLKAAFAAGHSLGEYSALAAAGAISAVEAIAFARLRGELMQQAGRENPGAMAAVLGLDEPAVEAICREAGAYVANYNSPGQVVISGEAPKVEAAGKLAGERGARKVVPLPVSGAFHTPLMAPAAKGLSAALAKVKWAEPAVPVIANTTARPIPGAAGINKELAGQLTSPVRWQQSVAALASSGADAFVEIGPGRVLTGLIKRISPESKKFNIGDAASLREYIEKGLPS